MLPKLHLLWSRRSVTCTAPGTNDLCPNTSYRNRLTRICELKICGVFIPLLNLSRVYWLVPYLCHLIYRFPRGEMASLLGWPYLLYGSGHLGKWSRVLCIFTTGKSSINQDFSRKTRMLRSLYSHFRSVRFPDLFTQKKTFRERKLSSSQSLWKSQPRWVDGQKQKWPHCQNPLKSCHHAASCAEDGVASVLTSSTTVCVNPTLSRGSWTQVPYQSCLHILLAASTTTASGNPSVSLSTCH